ncbi:MAG: DUF3298 domain-containing protein [Henriciella sp.]
MGTLKRRRKTCAKLAPAALGVLFMGACEPADTDPQQTARISERPQGTQDLDKAFAEPPGEGFAIVNGSQAASIEITMPQDMAALSPKLQEELDRRANAGSDDFVAASQADQQVASENDFNFMPHNLDVKWVRTGPSEGRLTGFVGTYAAYTGGAHANIGFDVLNWDVEDDRQIALEDLFDDDEAARTSIAKALKEKLLVAKRERLQDSTSSDADILETWVNPAFDGNIAVFEHFSIARSTIADKAGGLVYHFAPYEVGAYAEGVYVISVGHDHFADALNDTYKDAFGGEPILP